MRRAVWLGAVLAAASAGAHVATAAPRAAPAATHRAPPQVVAHRDDPVVRTLYLDRCVGGCTVHGGGVTDAATHSSSILTSGTFSLAAFDGADADWDAIVACVRDVYSPYDIAITDVKPTSGTYDEVLIAGSPTDVGLDGGAPTATLGIAQISDDCSPLADAVAFAFANVHAHDATFVDNVCWTAAQESAHLYGLDHEYVFTDGVSACRDPMTYREDCLGEKFFRPHEAYCGTYAEADCHCGAAQSSHRMLLSVLGPGAPTTAAPAVGVTSGLDQATIGDGDVVVAHASAQRGIDHVDLRLNGAVWATQPGVAFGSSGQPAADYALALPPDVPDGVIDVEVAAYDDLGIATVTPAVTVTKGEPCASSDACAPHQQCDATGRCAWPAATAQLGDACTYPQACATGLCHDGACTQACDIDDDTTCPAPFGCDGVGSNTEGLCARQPGAGAGCCDADPGPPGAPLVLLAAAAIIGRARRSSSRSRRPSCRRA